MTGILCGKRLLLVATAVVLALRAAAPAQTADFFFRDGDRVVMLGDSVTEFQLYSNYVETWTLCRFPTWNISFRNVGIGGNRSREGAQRFQRDVVKQKATAVTINFGLNDCNFFGPPADKLKASREGLESLASQARAAGIRVAWLSPNPLEPDNGGALESDRSELLVKSMDGMRKVAQAQQAPFVDQYEPYLALIRKARAAGEKRRLGAGDNVHPGPPGGVIMAWCVLQGLQFPALVSSAEIDAASTAVVRTERCEVTGTEHRDGGLRFQRRDHALPFFPTAARPALKLAPIDTDLNQYLLRVTHLPPGDYSVRIDGQAMSRHTAAELSAGVNLAANVLTNGPIAEQARAVYDAVAAKNTFYHDAIFRGIVLDTRNPDWVAKTPEEEARKKQPAIDQQLPRLQELEAAIRRALVQKPRQFDIVPANK